LEEQEFDPVRDAARRAVAAFLDLPDHAPLLRHWQTSLGLSRHDIEAGYMGYSLDSLDCDNDMYASAATHVAMWIEYQDSRSMHARRQQVVLDELRRRQARSIVDVGFGAPTQYVRDYVARTPGVQALLLDKYPAAIDVGRSMMSFWSAQWEERVRFAVHDMDVDAPIGGCDAYLFLDSIEHTIDPMSYLRATVSSARPDALFLLHMPVGPSIKSHSIAWDSDKAALAWLAAAGLAVDRTESILPNPAADHFARRGVRTTNLFVAGRKP